MEIDLVLNLIGLVGIGLVVFAMTRNVSYEDYLKRKRKIK